MTTATAENGLIYTDLAQDMEEQGQKFPALQVDDYQPSKLTDKVSIVISEDSLDIILSADVANAEVLPCEPVQCSYGEETLPNGEVVPVYSEMFKIPESARFVFLAPPPRNIFVLDKNEGKVRPLAKGDKLGGGLVTVVRLFVAIVNEGKFVVDSEGQPQIFTLKLTSNKTRFVRDDDNAERKTLYKMNTALQEAYKAKGKWLTSFVSVGLKAVPKVFASKISGQSSKGIDWNLDGNAKPLSKELQEQVGKLVSSESFIELAKNPFGNPNAAPPAPVDEEIDMNEGVPTEF